MNDQRIIKRVIYYAVLALWPLIFIYIFGPMVMWAQFILRSSYGYSSYIIIMIPVGSMAILYTAITLFLFYRHRKDKPLFAPLGLGFLFSFFYSMPLFSPVPTRYVH